MSADVERGHRTWISQKTQKRKVLKELVLLQILSRKTNLTISKCSQLVIQERARSNIETYLDMDIVMLD